MAPIHRFAARRRSGGVLMKTLLLACLIHHGVPFGLAGSEIRANRAPISCLSSASDGAVGKNVDGIGSAESTQLEQNAKYVNGLIETLQSLLDKWIVSGAMATRRRAYNILQQIERLAMDKELALKAERMAKRAGMPLAPPPPIPPTEHIPAVDQQNQQPETARIVKPMGAMADGDPDAATDAAKDRKGEADERLEWEKKHREKTEFMNKMKDNAPGHRPRSALSSRMANGKGGDPMLSGIVEGTNGGLDPFAFAEDKKQLQDTMGKAEAASTSEIAADVQQTIGSGGEPPDNAPPSSLPDPHVDWSSAKASELIARAGSGNAFLGSVLGVGGLDDVLAQIQRRVWIPLAAPPSLLSELGIQPVRGLLLYGAPGCGKTLLARKLGSILSPARPITIVSGPEILDKFVGSSEKNLREIFDNPPEIYHPFKKNYGEGLASQALHVIVLDEFDAIARRRGGSGGKGDQGDAGVARDSVVNQLLAKMDGVDGLGVPTLLVGLTNKPSLIDPALMRPGRFEVQIEVPKPRTVEQRVAILKVHTESMVKNGRVLVKDAPEGTAAWKRYRQTGDSDIPTYAELLDLIAVECDGLSGASLAGVSRAAASRALERAVTSFAGHIGDDSANDSAINGSENNSISDCLVLQDDFERAIEDVFQSAKGGDYSEEEAVASSASPTSEKADSVDDGDASIDIKQPL